MKELVPDEDPSKGLGDFFDFLWGEETGYVYLPNKNLKTDDWQKVMFEWPANRSEIIKYTLAGSARGHDVYVSPALFSERRPVKDNVKGTYFCWVDFDGNAPEAWPSTTPSEAQEPGLEALNRLEAAAPTPTLRISSSQKGHEHVYWKFKDFQTDSEYIEKINRSLAYLYKADTGGWDINQVLRPPYTTNFKRDKPVTITASTENEYDQTYFASFKRDDRIASENIEVKDVPSIESVIAKYPWDDKNFELFMRPEVEEGKRSSALMALGYFGAESGMQDNEIYAILLNADDRWGKFKNRRDRTRRLLDIVGNARKKYPVGANTAESALRGLLGSEENVEEAPKLVYGFDEFNKLEIEIEWIIEGLLERAGMALIASAPGVGKTQVSLQFALCCALGQPFLKWDVSKPLKILWFSLEMNAPALQYFTQKMGRAFSQDELYTLDKNLKIIPMGEVLPLDHPEGQKFLEALIEEFEPDGIVLDSMGKITNESLSDEKKAKELNAYYAKIRKKYDTFLWFIHHNRKANGDNKKPKELSDIYGNQYLSADLTTALSLWKEEGATHIDLNTIKTRLGPEQPTLHIKRDDNLLFISSEEVADSIMDSPLVKEAEKAYEPPSIDDGENPSGLSADFGF